MHWTNVRAASRVGGEVRMHMRAYSMLLFCETNQNKHSHFCERFDFKIQKSATASSGLSAQIQIPKLYDIP